MDITTTSPLELVSGLAYDTADVRSCSTSADSWDAIEFLIADHETVTSLFDDYTDTDTSQQKKALVAEICTQLSVHAQIEEEIFYPTVKALLNNKLLIPEATVEHASLKHLIAQIEGVEPDGEAFDARVQLLSEYVKHHVNEEHNEMFPKVRATTLDLDELGSRMAARKIDLLAARA